MNPLAPSTSRALAGQGVPRDAGLAIDGRGLEAIRRQGATDPRGAVREAARQFEALFMQELVKSMRSATLSSGMLDNAGSQMGTQMLDSQLALKMTGLPGGLSEAIARQLERAMGLEAEAAQPPAPVPGGRPAPAAALPPAAAAGAPAGSPAGAQADAPRGALEFLQRHRAAAERTEAATGIPAEFLLAQAAHETGWGRRDIRHADGTPSHNLFGIKAGPGWRGAVAEITTTEYEGGLAQKVQARFRAYASPEAAFDDYARMITGSPRWREALARADDPRGFAQGLQRGGYATDPDYADKLTRVINTTLRLQRLMG
jgi:flagellar protein FlgJ